MHKKLVAILIGFLPLSGFSQMLPLGTSLIKDGGFESGFASWSGDKGNNTLNTATPLFGSQSIRLGGAPGGRAQVITTGIEPGAKYRVSGYGSVSAASDLATIGVEFKNSSGVNILDQWIQVSGSPVKAYTFDVQVPFGTAWIEFYVFKNNGNQAVDLDGLNLVKIANP